MKTILITNNPLAQKKLSSKVETHFHDVDYTKVLKIARDYIHKGYRLLTHPLSGSVKPNETPYKSLIIQTREQTKIDMDSLLIIEQSLDTTKKFIDNMKTPQWNERIKEDFQTIDISLIESVLDRII